MLSMIFFNFSLCDHVKSAEECDDLITPSYLFWWFIPKPWLFAFITLTAIYLILKILIEIIRFLFRLRKKNP